MMHVISAATGVTAVREARAKGLPIYGETLHQYMLYNSADYRRPNGQTTTRIPRSKQRKIKLLCGRVRAMARSIRWRPTSFAAIWLQKLKATGSTTRQAEMPRANLAFR